MYMPSVASSWFVDDSIVTSVDNGEPVAMWHHGWRWRWHRGISVPVTSVGKEVL